MTAERRGVDVIAAAATDALGRLYDDPLVGETVRDAKSFADSTGFTPWAETYVGDRAEEIRARHSKGPDADVFHRAWELVRLAEKHNA